MVLDALTVTTFETVFPNMPPSSGPRFGGLLLLAYATVLLTGVVPLTYADGDGPDDTSAAPSDGHDAQQMDDQRHADGNGDATVES
jgi:hypothetical protein